MGNSVSSNEINVRVKELAMELSGDFAKDFAMAFRDLCVHDCIEEETTSSHQPEHALLQSATPSYAIKVGEMKKMGDRMKSWKRRWFVAANEEQNFSLIYYTNSVDMKEKGRISCHNYTIENFTHDEKANYGENGIKLQPINKSKRVWYLLADSEYDRFEWITTIMMACRLSAPETTVDKRCNMAFKHAYQNTRAAYGYFWAYRFWADEALMLQYITEQILRREILVESDNLGSSRSASMGRTEVNAKDFFYAVEKIVPDLMASTWRSSVEQTRQVADIFKNTVRVNLQKVKATEERLRGALSERICTYFQEFQKEFQDAFIKPMLSFYKNSIVEATSVVLENFHDRLEPIILSQMETEACTTRKSLKVESMGLLELGKDIERISSTSPLMTGHLLLWKVFILNNCIADGELNDTQLTERSSSLMLAFDELMKKGYIDKFQPSQAERYMHQLVGKGPPSATEKQQSSINIFGGLIVNRSGISGAQYYTEYMASLKALLRNALYTFLVMQTKWRKEFGLNETMSSTRTSEKEKMEISDSLPLVLPANLKGDAGDIVQIYIDVLARATKDACTSMVQILRQILRDIVEHRVQEVLLPTCSVLAIEIEDKSDLDFPEDIRNFLSINGVAKKILREQVEKFLDDESQATCDEMCGLVKERIDALSQTIPVKDI